MCGHRRPRLWAVPSPCRPHRGSSAASPSGAAPLLSAPPPPQTSPRPPTPTPHSLLSRGLWALEQRPQTEPDLTGRGLPGKASPLPLTTSNTAHNTPRGCLRPTAFPVPTGEVLGCVKRLIPSLTLFLCTNNIQPWVRLKAKECLERSRQVHSASVREGHWSVSLSFVCNSSIKLLSCEGSEIMILTALERWGQKENTCETLGGRRG